MMMIDTSKAICLASAIAMGLAATGVAVSSNLNASEIQVGRYSLLSAEPTEGQTDLLAPTVTVRFPAQIQTVGDSIRHLLRRSGYRLADAVALAPETIDLFALPLPAVHRQLGPMSLRRALEILAGPTPSVSCKILCIDSSHSNPVRRTGAVLATQAPARSARFLSMQSETQKVREDGSVQKPAQNVRQQMAIDEPNEVTRDYKAVLAAVAIGLASVGGLSLFLPDQEGGPTDDVMVMALAPVKTPDVVQHTSTDSDLPQTEPAHAAINHKLDTLTDQLHRELETLRTNKVDVKNALSTLVVRFDETQAAIVELHQGNASKTIVHNKQQQ